MNSTYINVLQYKSSTMKALSVVYQIVLTIPNASGGSKWAFQGGHNEYHHFCTHWMITVLSSSKESPIWKTFYCRSLARLCWSKKELPCLGFKKHCGFSYLAGFLLLLFPWLQHTIIESHDSFYMSTTQAFSRVLCHLSFIPLSFSVNACKDFNQVFSALLHNLKVEILWKKLTF